MVPPVPMPPTIMSTSPSVSDQISGPVVSRCTFGLSGLLNCWSNMASDPRELTISSALAMAPPIPLAAGVKTTSAPKALSRTRRSILMDSGMVSFSLYPLAAATMASPIPVFPEVGSTRMVFPGLMSPRFSASVIILRAMRSLTELAGLELSSLATICATQPSVTRFNCTNGVWPIKPKTFSAILAFNEKLRLVEEDILTDGTGLVETEEVEEESERGTKALTRVLVVALTVNKIVPTNSAEENFIVKRGTVAGCLCG
mmetsp:Transcript_68331/g.182035  ORF Transcript_68331/g.182035 Transcript_68331/m.182035 type:complete len:258 (-) Transcript_68331:106-879(-)